MDKNKDIIEEVIKETSLSRKGIDAVVTLTSEGATVPFIARYRKDKTGSLDEKQIRLILDRYNYYESLFKRREYILLTIEDQGKLTESLKRKINLSLDKQELEDLYLPFKRKNKTRAAAAREKGLSEFAKLICKGGFNKESFNNYIFKLLKINKAISCQEDAISGALDILSEDFAENSDIRHLYRDAAINFGIVKAKVKTKFKDKQTKYNNYYNYQEKLSKIPSHRLLAIRRAVNEGVLSRKLDFDETYIKKRSLRIINYKDSYTANLIVKAMDESYKRLLKPSIDKEVLKQFEQEAELTAANVFRENLYNLLMAAPAGRKKIMGIDPGFRSGSKVAIIDQQGTFIASDVIYPVAPFNKSEESFNIINDMIRKYQIDIISVGDGTASREILSFLKDKNNRFLNNVDIVRVSEDGASIYSASAVAQEEFPDLDLTIRGAISIARRVQDPLAELVKIDPKSLGIGQYQHDINSNLLENSLSEVIETVVNKVGAELNTSSEHLLKNISGIGEKLAKNIKTYRTENGPFKTKKELLKVPMMGEKSFMFCAGFLRVQDSANPLDYSAIHPESYQIAEKIAFDNDLPIKQLIGNDFILDRIKPEIYVKSSVGLETVKDIIKELKKPAIDPREDFSVFDFSENIKEIEDLKVGDIVPGIVSNVADFGAFVDIGLKKDALLHISEVSNTFVTNIHQKIVKDQKLKVKIIAVDLKTAKVSLSLKK